jgi:hypothetical protein
MATGDDDGRRSAVRRSAAGLLRARDEEQSGGWHSELVCRGVQYLSRERESERASEREDEMMRSGRRVGCRDREPASFWRS